MANKFLDEQGLRYLWTQLKAKFSDKVDKVEGKGLSTNDFTDALKTKLDNISAGANSYEHPTYEARTGKPESNQRPDFGDAVNVSQVISNELGHVTQMYDRSITIPDTVMTAATATQDGKKGLVPIPRAGDQTKFLRGDGDWATVVTQDEKVGMLLNRNTKAYLLGATDEPTKTTKYVSAIADTGVYLDTEAGSLVATNFSGGGANITNISAGNIATGTVNAARLPAVSQSTQGAMSAADKIKLDGFDSADTYAKKTDITSMYRHKGSVQNEDALPATGNTAGDVYNVLYKKSDGSTYGMNYVWTGTGWDAIGEIFVIDSITNTDIDGILRT